MTYDTTSHTVTVEVVDNGQGQLVATPTGNNPTFTNTYKAAATTATVKAKKVLTGKALEAEKYTFKLTEVGGNNVELQATNDANGNIKFPEINYDKEGTYTYKLKEVAGSEAGVTYDSTEHTVTVTVTENNAKLEAAVTDNNPTFTNSYKDYGVSYEFLSSNPAYPNLPKEVTDLLPADTNRYTSGTNVDAKQPAKTSVTVTEGTWTFEGHAETNAQTVADKDLKFTGKWNFTPAPKYKVTYEFVSEDPNRALPAEVTELLPTDANEYTDGTAVQAVQPAKDSIEVTGGTWKFLKYDADSKTIAGSDVKFTGTWTFEARRPQGPTPPPSSSDSTPPSSSGDKPVGSTDGTPGNSSDKDGKDVRGSATGKKVLPKTGSETSIFAIAAGFALILLSALVYRFKKAN